MNASLTRRDLLSAGVMAAVSAASASGVRGEESKAALPEAAALAEELTQRRPEWPPAWTAAAKVAAPTPCTNGTTPAVVTSA